MISLNGKTHLTPSPVQSQQSESLPMTFDMNRAPGFAISRTYQMQRAKIRNAVSSLGYKFTPEEVVILIKLDTLKVPIRMGALAKELKRDATTITRLLDGMEKKKVIERKQDPKDRRAICVALSPLGSEALESLLPCMNEIRERMMQGISSEHLEITINTLLLMQENLSAE